MTFITEIEKSTLKFLWKHKRLWIVKTIQSKMNNTGGITVSHFKLYYRAIAIKTARWWNKNEDHRHRIEDPDKNPHSYAHVIFDKGTKNKWRIKDSLFNKCWIFFNKWENWISLCRKLKLDPCLSPCTSINSEWVNDVNIKPETLKLLQEQGMHWKQ
jgi:hypothetical protein